MVGSKVITTEPQSNIEKHIVFLDMLQRGELLRSELLRKARLEEIKSNIRVMFEHERKKFDNAYKESTFHYRYNIRQQKYFIVQ